MKRFQLFLLLILLSLPATTSPVISDITISESSDLTGVFTATPDTLAASNAAGSTAIQQTTEEHSEEHAEEEHAGDMTPLLFVIIALVIGAGTRHWLRKSPLPYTVSLLVIGLILGAMNRLGWFGKFSLGSINLNLDFLGEIGRAHV